MYSTCIYCHHNLGTNEAVERFPIGRRLAFDVAKGRLWVVCRVCERWNLTPLDERWEAIDECERVFRASTLRYSTQEIGLARIADGTDLLRIGQPTRPEFAAWRYGDQFGRRRRRAALQGGIVATAVGVASYAGLSVGVGLLGVAYLVSYLAVSLRPDAEQVVARIQLDRRPDLLVQRKDLRWFRLIRSAHGARWQLVLPDDTTAAGTQAVHAAGVVLPLLNRRGGRSRQVKHAVELIGRSERPDLYFREAAAGAPLLARLPSTVRLALEMAAHEEVERRAMEGELAELMKAWRQAEEIAAISDVLLTPAVVERALVRIKGEMRARSRQD